MKVACFCAVWILHVAGQALQTKRGQTFTLFKSLYTWNEAQDVCDSIGQKMLIIRNQEESTVFETIAEKWKTDKFLTKDIWTGLYDRQAGDVSETQYHWQGDCSPLGSPFSLWQDAEPNNQDQDFCVRLDFSSYRFRTTSCDMEGQTVCQNEEDCQFETLDRREISMTHVNVSSPDVASCQELCLTRDFGDTVCVACDYTPILSLCRMALDESLYNGDEQPKTSVSTTSSVYIKRCFIGYYNQDKLNIVDNSDTKPTDRCTTSTTATTGTSPTVTATAIASIHTTSTTNSDSNNSTPTASTAAPTDSSSTTAATIATTTSTATVTSGNVSATTITSIATTSTYVNAVPAAPTTTPTATTLPPTTTATTITGIATIPTSANAVPAAPTTTSTAATILNSAASSITTAATVTSSSTTAVSTNTTAATLFVSTPTTTEPSSLNGATTTTPNPRLINGWVICNSSSQDTHLVCICRSHVEVFNWKDENQLLLLEKTSLSSYRRSKTSVVDDRPSAISLGTTGTAVIIIVVISIASKDLYRCCVWLLQLTRAKSFSVNDRSSAHVHHKAI